MKYYCVNCLSESTDEQAYNKEVCEYCGVELILEAIKEAEQLELIFN